MLTKAEFSWESNEKFLKGSHTSMENGSKLLPRRLPKKLGIKDIFFSISWNCFVRWDFENQNLLLYFLIREGGIGRVFKGLEGRL